MDTPGTSRKRPVSSSFNTEARQPTASVGSISPPCVLRSPSTPLPRWNFYSVRFKVFVVERQRKNKASIHRTAQHFSIEGGRNRERKCRIPRISPPLRFVLKLKLQKGGCICGTLRYQFCWCHFIWSKNYSLVPKLCYTHIKAGMFTCHQACMHANNNQCATFLDKGRFYKTGTQEPFHFDVTMWDEVRLKLQWWRERTVVLTTWWLIVVASCVQ